MKKLHLNYRSKQRGLTNIQVGVGIAVLAIALLGGMFMLKYPTNMKANNEMQEVIDLRASTTSYASTHNGIFTGFTANSACVLNFFPSNRCTGSGGTTSISNTWGGVVTVAPATTVNTDDSLTWTYQQVPSRACTDEVTNLWSTAAKILVNSTIVKSTPATAINDVTISTACTTGTDSNSIGYTFTAR